VLYRKMPQNGDELSILGFGCMRLPTKDGKIDEPSAIRQIRYAIDCGVNYVDTAWPYHAGESEVVLGKALRDGYRQKVKVASKLPSWLLESRDDMDRFLAAQLAKLETDHIDYYLVHALDGTLWDNVRRLGVCEFLDQAKKDGRIGNAGFSFHGLPDDFPRIVDGYPWVFCQIQYNFLDENNQAGTAGLEYAAAKGLGVIVMEPLRGGNLALPKPPPAVAAIWDEAKVRRTPADWALRWVWNRPEVTVVLSGMGRLEQVQENLSIADSARANTLTEEELALVQRVGGAYRDLMKVDCTGCGYCMPCPTNVKIPLCFEEYNTMKMFGGVDEAKFRYALRLSGELVDGQPGYASLCAQCGECIDKCPQKIPIPDKLAEVAAAMEDGALGERVAIARRIFSVRPD
jgi:uncharacterized protein